MSGPFKMKGSSFYGHGNASPAKQGEDPNAKWKAKAAAEKGEVLHKEGVKKAKEIGEKGDTAQKEYERLTKLGKEKHEITGVERNTGQDWADYAKTSDKNIPLEYATPAKHSVRQQVASTRTEKAKTIDVEHTHSKEDEERIKKGELKSETIRIKEKKASSNKYKASPAKGKVHTHPHPEEKKSLSRDAGPITPKSRKPYGGNPSLQ